MILAALLLAATPAGGHVVVVRDAAAVAGCQSLGEVRASSMMGGVLANAAYNKVMDQMKAKAAALGGTHVQIVDSASGYAGSRAIGTAFLCKAPESASSNP